MSIDTLEFFLTTEQASELLQISPKTLQNWRCLGEGPPFKKLGSLVRYPSKALEDWAQSQTPE